MLSARFLCSGALVGFCIGAGAGPARGAEESRSVVARDITPALRLAIRRGHEYLSHRQSKVSGNIEGAGKFPVAVNGLAGLAFLAGGHTDQSGPYRETVAGLTRALLGYQTSTGYFSDEGSRMYGHGFATLYLAELYGMSGSMNEQIRDALKKAVTVIERSQAKGGGWDYEPAAPFGGTTRSTDSDTSITVCQTMALRAARNLGIQVDAAVVDRARGYVLKAQRPNGSFNYRLGLGSLAGGPDPPLPRSAAGVCVLIHLAKEGDHDSEKMRQGFDYLLANYRARSAFEFYGYYYAAQAMFHAGGKYWAEYFPYLRDRLIQSQQVDGSWEPTLLALEVTPQATAMALIALQIPFRFLPITEK